MEDKSMVVLFIDDDPARTPKQSYQNDNRIGVGNGGISLRSKSIMKEIIN